MYHLVMPRTSFEQTPATLMRQPNSLAVGTMGRNHTANRLLLLGKRLEVVATSPPLSDPGARLILQLARTPTGLHEGSWRTVTPPAAGHLTAWLTLGTDTVRGQGRGAVITAQEHVSRIATLTLVGPEMATIALHPPDTPRPPRPRPAQDGPWSRTIGALGGLETWQCVTALRPCLIGVSRSGSLMATTLAQLGVQQLTLIDPDVVEAHLLDAMDSVTPEDIGRAKATAVAARLRTLRPDLEVLALPCRVTERPALQALEEAGV